MVPPRTGHVKTAVCTAEQPCRAGPMDTGVAMADPPPGVLDVPADDTRRGPDTRYRALFEFLPDGILIADHESRYIDANAKICRMLGYARAELIGLTAVDIVVPAEAPHVAAAVASILETSDYQRE